MAVQIKSLTGGALESVVDDLARLRIEVFRAYPYLYDGDLAYERDYLKAYCSSGRSIVVGAYDAGRLVGAATAAPLEDHAAEFGAPFEARSIDFNTVFYCGESVLLPQYRGQGIGHAFFEAREAHGVALGRTVSAFCAVERGPDHPGRPDGYRPHDVFWTKRGYRRQPDMVTEFAWKDVGDSVETRKRMVFWMKEL